MFPDLENAVDLELDLDEEPTNGRSSAALRETDNDLINFGASARVLDIHAQ